MPPPSGGRTGGRDRPLALPDARQTLAASVDLVRDATPCESVDAAAAVVLRVVVELTGADQGTIGLIGDGEVAIVAAAPAPRVPAGSRFPVGFGVAGWVAATERVAEIGDVREDRRYVALTYPEVRSFVGVPLSTRGDTVGVLGLAAWRPNAFPQGLGQALAPLAEQAAAILRHAQTRGEERARLTAAELTMRETVAERLHDLKAPLNTVTGFLEIVAREQAGPLSAQQKEFLETARSECERLKQGLGALIESRAADQRTAERTVERPAELAATAVQRARGEALSRGVELEMEIDPSTPPVEVNREAVLQVLANLLQNALRVSSAGATVTLAVAGVDGWSSFMVADQGPGVAESDLETIFQRHGQAPAGGVAGEPGQVGLGLWLSRQIVERHGGLIWAENRERRAGARFCFAVPAGRT